MAAIVLPALSKDSFTDIPPDEAVQGSAMLQTSAKAGPRGVMLQAKSSPVKKSSSAAQSSAAHSVADNKKSSAAAHVVAGKSSPAAHGFADKSKSECGAFGAKSYVKQSRSCLPLDLQERHLQAIRHHAALVAMGSRSLSDISLLAAKAATGTKPNSSKSHSAMKSRSLLSQQGGRKRQAPEMPPDIENQIPSTTTTEEPAGPAMPPDIENQIPSTTTTEEPEEEDSGPAMPPDIENQIPSTTTTEAPEATEAPATEAPATEAPATEAPAKEAPATEAPATEAPTNAPATKAPATEAPKAAGKETAAREAAAAAAAREAAAAAAASSTCDGQTGSTAPLDASGFICVTSLCCPSEMEIFFTRLLHSMQLDVCSVPHIQGLMHWFSCVPDMDFGYVIEVIQNGNPCKFWAPWGTECPILSPECAGHWCR
jgi:hypothetical protein